MVKKAIDARIPALIRNGMQEKKRSFFVIVGDRQKDVIVNLYHILLNLDIKLNKSVLWAYKNKLLGFTSHRKKREKKIKKEVKRGIRDPDAEDPFELFVSTQNIRYVYYKETDRILGNTYGMCILQDFEAITPNLLARTIETVEGGGLVILLLKGMNSLKQLYAMSMDIHSRYRTEAHGDVVARFNERFILSLGSCDSCLVIDDEMNVLPVSGGRSVVERNLSEDEARKPASQRELEEIKESLADTQPVGSLVQLAWTKDQAQALLTFVEAISEKTLASTVTLTAARGRGKSAALGVAIATAVAHGYSNIFITSPSPENLKTLFEFIFKGFDALGYLDHADYTIIQSTNPDFNKAIVRVNIHRAHRQTIQYIQPQDAYTLGQAELLVIDEAAAIPLPLVRKLMGPYLVFMASTINGYEGTGRSLSLKLIQQLREQSRGQKALNGDQQVANRSNGDKTTDGAYSGPSARSLREITLSEPIRYSQGDSVEKWLNKLLCLDATLPRSSNVHGTPHPSQCQLLQVNRDTLFSFHPVSEKFLQNMMALYVASHYKNTPNDLQLMSDAPAHQLFVLVPPVRDDTNQLPDILCVLQVALEGQISKESVLSSLSRGQRAGGDLIPWLVSQQFQDSEFASLSGARVVRIATNPDYGNMGYGSRALQLLTEFYEGKHVNLSESDELLSVHEQEMVRVTDAELEQSTLMTDNVKVRDIKSMPPLFARLSERKPYPLDYLGVSYGLTQPLHKFWKRAGYVPVYIRQTANDLTGEHTTVMLKTLETGSSDPSWLGAYAKDFHRRFLSLLSYEFRKFGSVQALAIDESANMGISLLDDLEKARALEKAGLDDKFSPFDLKRLDSYANNMLDYHVILDLMPEIARLYFEGRIKNDNGVKMSGVQQALLIAIGLQRKALEDVEKELGLQTSQLLAMFVKVMRKVSMHFRQLQEGAIAKEMPQTSSGRKGVPDEVDGEGDVDMDAVGKGLKEELAAAGADFDEEQERKRKAEDDEFAEAKKAIKAGKADGTFAVRSAKKEDKTKRKAGEALAEVQREAEALEAKRSKKSETSAYLAYLPWQRDYLPFNLFSVGQLLRTARLPHSRKMVRVEYRPEASHPLAIDFLPQYLHEGIPDWQGRPDVKIRDEFFGTRRKLRIGVLGAGISCLNFLHFAEERLQDVEMVVYEKNEDVGGVWLTSRYPGCRCDIPSIVYQFSWRTNVWSEMYAPAAENLAYLKTVAKENDFYRYIKFQHEIQQASWTDREAMWTLTVKDLVSGDSFDDKFHVFLEFNGPVSNPRLNPLAGIEDFKGEVIHPALWSADTSVEGKRICLIGYGCSGVQIAPNIIDQASKLYTWFRNKTYILPPPNQPFSAVDGANFKYSDEQKELLKDPDNYLAYRKAVDDGFYRRYSYVVNGSKMSQIVKENTVKYMKAKLQDKPKLLEAILPEDFDIGCRRQTFAYGYLEAIMDPKATVFTELPQRFTKHGIVDANSVEHPLDMIVAATGYDQSHMPRFPKLINGKSVSEFWHDPHSPPSYMALMLKGMPNYFNPSSAYGPLPQGNYYQSSEAFAKYIVKAIEKMQLDCIVSVTPKDKAVDQFVRHANAFLKRTAVTGPCVSWYKGNDYANAPALWPGARSQFLRVIDTPRFEDFDIVYEDEDDMFAFMANGWTLQDDGDEAADKTW
ncbi:DUF699-domain-containing protein [Teratosphaeria nubilosa]|uniref:RNA cytidine acetyltransferase n=1 Tax=Teratosphaeria nubilosa TaxID=161662 RepID=A0A6G1LGU7_9PEZI|nr:DUF699-domain-containing protein [Teratosphaeria nubilosa]